MTDEVCTFRSDMSVTLIDHMGNDAAICQAARVSTQGAESYQTGEAEGLINFLVRERHGSPLEHAVFTWLIEAPIFVWREFMRHRIASYNEESGRYKQLKPVFYLPAYDRPLVQVGKTGNYTFEPGDTAQYMEVVNGIEEVCEEAYDAYVGLLAAGIAKEVARMVLPVSIYSSAYVTMNLRGLMNFLSLRTKRENATFKSHPQHEIMLVADEMEESVADIVPLAMAAFDRNGRVCP